ncbi:MAG: TlpA family protein disulfide reductase [Bernardetiaceae bacterium]
MIDRSKVKIIRQISLFLGILVGMAACGDAGPLEKGNPAPDFSMSDLDGVEQSLAAHRGKVVMLYFWADWCPTCKKEFPQTQAFYQELGGEDFEILAVNVGQPAEASRKFRQAYQATFPMLTDSTSSLTKTYEVEVLPTNYFIDPEGKIIRRIIGFVDKNQARVMIEQHRSKI